MIGERIKQARLALGYSAEQVAAFLGVSPATVYRYENGDISKLPSKFIKPLAQYLCVSPSWLMGWTEEPPDDPVSDVPATRESRNDIGLIYPDEADIIKTYRSLPAPGKQYVQQQLVAARLMYGEKPADSAAADK